jgi:hypothetical protein
VYYVVPSAQRRRDEHERGQRRKCEVFGQYPPRSGTRKMLHGKASHAYSTQGLRLRLAWLAHADDVNRMPAIDRSPGLTTDSGILGVETVDHHADVIARAALILVLTSKPDGNF